VAKYSQLRRRYELARDTGDDAGVRAVKEEVLRAFTEAGGDLDAAAAACALQRQAYRKLAKELGLSVQLGLKSLPPRTLLARMSIASATNDAAEFERIKRDIIEAIELCDGLVQKSASEYWGISYGTLSKIIAELGIAKEIHERFPGKGKPRLITAKVNGKKVTRSMAEWSEKTGVKRTTIKYRLDTLGLSPEQALSTEDMRTK
jgi:hypothetical protein